MTFSLVGEHRPYSYKSNKCDSCCFKNETETKLSKSVDCKKNNNHLSVIHQTRSLILSKAKYIQIGKYFTIELNTTKCMLLDVLFVLCIFSEGTKIMKKGHITLPYGCSIGMGNDRHRFPSFSKGKR